ncbi:hypothetical protein AKJ65_06165 [candidate division MSBL1 archaeon SCGC-AAA259E19]|uniref:Uncharacterized protein n=1 Tax=candidate division MSBL1 archaeon SCGC-AAA259E19 TaxID=1698264 RepID=A0A133UHD0_9EURY|nr:hypothetical protein AKJ65_06165 [candidate division MSBL1 archaeon SCGC-AAA259E19]
MSESTTIRIEEEPTQHILRNLKANLTLELDESCSFHDSVLFLIANTALSDSSIKNFINCYRGGGYRHAQPNQPSKRATLLKLVEELMMSNSPTDYTIDKTVNSFSEISEMAVETDDSIGEEKRQELFDEINQDKERFRKVLKKIQNFNPESLWRIE